jgi:capsular polysaccharide biosynthesis protein
VTYVKGLEQSRIDEALRKEGLSNLSVIQFPSFVPKAAAPKKALTLALAFLAGFGGAVGVILLSEHLDESIRTISGAEQQLRLRVFASLPTSLTTPKLPPPAVSNEYWRAYV